LTPDSFHLNTQNPGRAQQRHEVKGPPLNRFVGIDLREVAARALGGLLHERAAPLLADAYAHVFGPGGN
jgi:hypothetical protein